MYEREKLENEMRERQQREKAAQQVSAAPPTRKKVEQRISTMSEAQVMEKLSKHVSYIYIIKLKLTNPSHQETQ